MLGTLFYYSAIDHPSISLAMCHQSVSDAAFSMAQKQVKKSLLSQVRMGKKHKNKTPGAISPCFLWRPGLTQPEASV